MTAPGTSGRGGVLPAHGRRELAWDAAAFLLACAGGLLVAFAGLHDSAQLTGVIVADRALGVLSCLALCFRRRWPFEIALAVSLATGFSETAAMASVVALFTVAVYCPVKQSVMVSAIGLSATPIYAVARARPEQSFGFVMAVGVLTTVAVLGWGLFVRHRRQLLASLRERAARAETEAQLRAEQAQNRARERIAREMHDVLGHRLSLLSVQAGALEYRRDASPEEVTTAAAVIRASAHQALEDLREVIGVLRAEVRELPPPTLADLDGLVAESCRAGMRVGVTSGIGSPVAAPERLGRTAYRILQEALTNARKHAPRGAVSVVLDGAPGQGLTVEVTNATSSVLSAPGTGQGLVGLAERATLAGGYLCSQRIDRRTWRLWAWLPWPAPAPDTPAPDTLAPDPGAAPDPGTAERPASAAATESDPAPTSAPTPTGGPV